MENVMEKQLVMIRKKQLFIHNHIELILMEVQLVYVQLYV